MAAQSSRTVSVWTLTVSWGRSSRDSRAALFHVDVGVLLKDKEFAVFSTVVWR